jgi:hypothetical protein
MMPVSSANKIGLDSSDIIFGRSLIYNKKSTGPSTDPYGTPYCISFHSEQLLFPFLYKITL